MRESAALQDRQSKTWGRPLVALACTPFAAQSSMETFAHVAQVSQQFMDKAASGDSLALGGIVIIAGLVAASGFMVSPSSVTATSSRFVLPPGDLWPACACLPCACH